MKTSEVASARGKVWRDLILQQKKSGLPVQRFCQQHGVSWHSFYQWRKRLAMSQPVRFALVELREAGQQDRAGLKVWLSSCERLQIGSSVDAATLRTVLAVLRERQ